MRQYRWLKKPSLVLLRLFPGFTKADKAGESTHVRTHTCETPSIRPIEPNSENRTSGERCEGAAPKFPSSNAQRITTSCNLATIAGTLRVDPISSISSPRLDSKTTTVGLLAAAAAAAGLGTTVLSTYVVSL